jgi:TRAP-type uncharacterized transport system fused permease subunit
MATVPTVLYYASVAVMIEGDARRGTTPGATPGAPVPVPGRAAPCGWHFTSLVAIGAFMVAGMTAFRAVFWATVLAAAVSYLCPGGALTLRRLVEALRAGGQDVVPVAVTTATAGIIVGVVTLTGLGLEAAGLIVTLAGGNAVLTVGYAAVAVWLLGLAVPVTASYIIAAVMIAPALVTAGIPAPAAHMFIFYYAVLSEVSPPTALSPFAAAAITGADPFRTMVLTWRYTLPAFVVPLVFTLAPSGAGVLLRGSLSEIVVGASASAAGIVALAGAVAGWLGRRVGITGRAALAAAGLLLLFGSQAVQGLGAAALAVVLVLQFVGSPSVQGRRTSG